VKHVGWLMTDELSPAIPSGKSPPRPPPPFHRKRRENNAPKDGVWKQASQQHPLEDNPEASREFRSSSIDKRHWWLMLTDWKCIHQKSTQTVESLLMFSTC
jgi:hypothetical protein